MVFFYLVTTGWVFDISLCENSINQSMLNKLNDRETDCFLLLRVQAFWLAAVVLVVNSVK